ncbi:hypothetical protein ABVT39_019203 [Epinephelus coioides]
MKSYSSEGHSFVCWTSFDTSGLDAKTLTVSQLSLKPPLSDTLHETVTQDDRLWGHSVHQKHPRKVVPALERRPDTRTFTAGGNTAARAAERTSWLRLVQLLIDCFAEEVVTCTDHQISFRDRVDPPLLPPPLLLPSPHPISFYSGTDSVSEYVGTCASLPCQIFSQMSGSELYIEAGTVNVRRRCLCNSCCETHLPGCIL